jgi:hypothetical protein
LWNELGWDVGGTQTLSSKATCATPFVLDWLTAASDPRIDFIYEKPPTGHLGVIQGLDQYDSPIVDAFIPENVSNIGPGILKSGTMGANIFTLAEAYFLRAEAAVNGDHTGDPRAYYEAGIDASFAYLGADGSSTYYSQTKPNVGWAASPDKIEAIITQKWIATNGITAEQSWFDYNRTGFPTGLPISAFMIGVVDDRPTRLFYPASEVSSNGENVPDQPDAFNSYVFWAGK